MIYQSVLQQILCTRFGCTLGLCVVGHTFHLLLLKRSKEVARTPFLLSNLLSNHHTAWHLVRWRGVPLISSEMDSGIKVKVHLISGQGSVVSNHASSSHISWQASVCVYQLLFSHCLPCPEHGSLPVARAPLTTGTTPSPCHLPGPPLGPAE